jgi:hypothetical protein
MSRSEVVEAKPRRLGNDLKVRKGVVDAVDVACSALPVNKSFTYYKKQGPPLPPQVWDAGEGGVTTLRAI